MGKVSSRYSHKNFIWSSHQAVAGILKQTQVESILDIGCDEGFLGRSLYNKPKLLIGIDKREIREGIAMYKKVFKADIESTNLKFLGNLKFKAIVLADILEHLKKPSQVLSKLKPFLKKDGFMVICVPNMGFILVKALYLLGIKPKMDRALFDRTHLHDFDLNTIKKFLKENQLKVTGITFLPVPLPIFSMQFNKGGVLHLFYKLAYYLSQRFPNLFGYQILIKATLRK